MSTPAQHWIDGLVVVNVALAALCLCAVLVVCGAVVCDLRGRRRRRVVIPDGWPPSADKC